MGVRRAQKRCLFVDSVVDYEEIIDLGLLVRYLLILP